ncbi:hypothetical protein Bbelb_181600 [Branchiostoma belcheri]|nr:hypothetical protein Bbelb_181600 [Branchiostoma belcheri]
MAIGNRSGARSTGSGERPECVTVDSDMKKDNHKKTYCTSDFHFDLKNGRCVLGGQNLSTHGTGSLDGFGPGPKKQSSRTGYSVVLQQTAHRKLLQFVEFNAGNFKMTANEVVRPGTAVSQYTDRYRRCKGSPRTRQNGTYNKHGGLLLPGDADTCRQVEFGTSGGWPSPHKPHKTRGFRLECEGAEPACLAGQSRVIGKFGIRCASSPGHAVNVTNTLLPPAEVLQLIGRRQFSRVERSAHNTNRCADGKQLQVVILTRARETACDISSCKTRTEACARKACGGEIPAVCGGAPYDNTATDPTWERDDGTTHRTSLSFVLAI